jgi:hypothetical protein
MKRSTALVSGLALVASAIGCDGRREPKNAFQLKLPTETPKRPQGMKALEVKPGATPFTAEDVTQYVTTHRLARITSDLSQLRVESLEFISAREATSRLQGVSTGLPNDDRLGFAIIRGPVYFTGPPPGKPVAFERAYALFDAGTGNLLMSGTLDSAKQPPQ